MSHLSRLRGWIAGATAVLVTLVALFNVVPAAREAWCKSVALFCIFDIQKTPEETISLLGSPSNDRTICYEARIPFSRLTNMAFEPKTRDPIYWKGQSEPKTDVPGLGYTVVENTKKRYCVKIWARRVNDTYYPSLEGHIEGSEWITIF